MLNNTKAAFRLSILNYPKRTFSRSPVHLTKVHVVDQRSSIGAAKKQTSVLQTVGHATATGSYFLAVSAGSLLLGIVMYALFSNLFYETRYFGEAVDMVKNNPEIKRCVFSLDTITF